MESQRYQPEIRNPDGAVAGRKGSMDGSCLLLGPWHVRPHEHDRHQSGRHARPYIRSHQQKKKRYEIEGTQSRWRKNSTEWAVAQGSTCLQGAHIVVRLDGCKKKKAGRSSRTRRPHYSASGSPGSRDWAARRGTWRFFSAGGREVLRIGRAPRPVPRHARRVPAAPS